MTSLAPKVAIVGTGRHGSGYLATVMSEAGLACGHEAWWNPTGERTSGLLADSSWCALPWLPWHRGPVLHQTRHPLDVISSFVKAPEWGPYLDLKHAIAGWRPDLSPVQQAARWYLACNLSAEARADARWRVEDLGVGSPDDGCRILGDVLGNGRANAFRIARGLAAAAADVPTTTNDHGPGDRLTAEQLVDEIGVGVYLQLVLMAHRYGYELPYA